MIKVDRMRKATRVPLLVDKNIAAKLVALAGDESRVNHYLAAVIQTLYADQQALSEDIRLEHIKVMNALIDKQNEYKLENRTLRKRLNHMVAANQELLAMVQLLMGASPRHTGTSFEQHMH
jgi:hypothetical protein